MKNGPFLRLLVAGAGFVIGAGCTPTVAVKEASQLADDAYERGIERGRRETWRALHGGRRDGSEWQQPVFQRVRVPERMKGGVLELEHEEIVIVRPGRYVTDEDEE